MLLGDVHIGVCLLLSGPVFCSLAVRTILLFLTGFDFVLSHERALDPKRDVNASRLRRYRVSNFRLISVAV